MSLPRTRRMSTLSLGVAAAVLAGWSSGTTASDERLSSSPAGDAHTAIVVITSDKCVADRASYDAGGMGFKDGTNNVNAEDAAELDQFVWVDDETDQPWMKGGS